MLSKDDKVLFVDDEVNVLNTIKRNLIGLPIELFFASSGEEALEVLKKESIKVVVSDLKMPGMTGIQLMEIVQKEYPAIIKIVLTGNAQVPNILATINKTDIFRFMVKPWKFEEEFIPAIKQAIQLYNANQTKNELMQAIEVKNDQSPEENKHWNSLVGLIEKCNETVRLVQSNIQQLSNLDREALDKVSLEMYSQVGTIATNLNVARAIIDLGLKKGS